MRRYEWGGYVPEPAGDGAAKGNYGGICHTPAGGKGSA
jgi:hypothetical protein